MTRGQGCNSHFMDEEAGIMKARRMASGKLALAPRSSDSEPSTLLPPAPSYWSLWLEAGPSAPRPLARWSCRGLKHSARAELELSFLQDRVPFLQGPGARSFPRARCHLQGPQDVLPAFTCLLAAVGVEGCRFKSKDPSWTRGAKPLLHKLSITTLFASNCTLAFI